MGTRADFYVGRGENAEWVGSIAWDGYPKGITLHGEKMETPSWPGARPAYVREQWPNGEHLFDADDKDIFAARVERFFLRRDDVSLPSDGWPWPWETSATTDYAYAFDGGDVYISCYGREWYPASEWEQREQDKEDEDTADNGKTAVFPDMTSRQNVQFGGNRSGLIVVG